MAPGWRAFVEIDRAEAADSDGFERTGGLEEFEATGDGFGRSGGGDDGGGEVVGAGACSADELGTAGFNCRKCFHGVGFGKVAFLENRLIHPTVCHIFEVFGDNL